MAELTVTALLLPSNLLAAWIKERDKEAN